MAVVRVEGYDEDDVLRRCKIKNLEASGGKLRLFSLFDLTEAL